MRIAFYGNIANNLYQIVQALREYTDLDANLYLRTNDQFTTQPESDNAELKNNYPDWIIQRPFSGTKNVLMPWQAPLTHELGQSDLSIVCGYGPIYAQFTGKPVCFFTTGSDLTSFPFPATFLPSYKGLRTKIYALLAGYWQRRGIRHVTEIWTQPFFPFMNALNEIGIEAGDPRIVKAYFPLILNTQLFKFDPQARSRSDPNIQRIVANYDFVVFHPSRLMIRDLPMLKRAGQWKRNDLLFRGLKRFLLMLSPTQAARVGLVMPDRLYSDDLALGKRLITDLGLDANVFWAK